MMQAEYQQRRSKLMAKIGNGTAIFHSAPSAVMHNDVEYTYRQDSDFFYLTGFNEPSAVAVLAPHHPEHKFVLFVRPKNIEQETWSGYRAGIEGAKELYGADEAFPITELDEKLPQYLENADQIYYKMGQHDKFNQTVIKHWQRLIRFYPRKGKGPTGIQDAGVVLHPLRLFKSEQELQLMRKAMKISVAAHNHALFFARPGRAEYEVQAEMEYIFASQGAMIAYPSIVASGANACILHYIENQRQMQEQDLLLIDAGCAYQYYNADITRTFPVGKKFTAEQRLIYDIVLRSQLAAIEQIKPGIPYNQVHDTAVRVIVEGLVNLGLLAGNIDDLIKEEKYKPFYMHKTGHWLGLDVHDVGVYQWGDNPQLLQPGQVFTVEPGIYIRPGFQPAEGQPAVDEKWQGIGVRIEDDILVTNEGHEVLTAGVPKAIADLEDRY